MAHDLPPGPGGHQPLSEEEADWLQEREKGGQMVRAVWIAYCQRIGDTKPSHVAPWEDLSEADQEADRVIWEAVWMEGFSAGAGSAFAVSGSLDRLIPLDDATLERYLATLEDEGERGADGT